MDETRCWFVGCPVTFPRRLEYRPVLVDGETLMQEWFVVDEAATVAHMAADHGHSPSQRVASGHFP